MQHFLQCVEGKEGWIVKDVSLNRPGEYIIGRRRGVHVVCHTNLVSRNHAVLTVKPNFSVYIRDLNSSNGIYINDVKITPNTDHLLHINDLIGVGVPPGSHYEKEIFKLRRENYPDNIVTGTDSSGKASTSKTIFDDIVIIDDSDDDNDDKPDKKPSDKSSEIDVISNISQCRIKENDSTDCDDNISISSEQLKNTSDKVNTTDLLQSANNNSDIFVKPSDKLIKYENHKDNSDVSLQSEIEVQVENDKLNNIKQENSYSFSQHDDIVELSDEDDLFPKSQLFDDIEVKKEPGLTINNYSFSQQEDIVELSDDDDIFPRSQLFDDAIVKEEPQENPSSVSQNLNKNGETLCISTSDNFNDAENYFSIIKKEAAIDDDYNVPEEEEIADSDDDDCEIWFSKLSQSQNIDRSQVFEVDIDIESKVDVNLPSSSEAVKVSESHHSIAESHHSDSESRHSGSEVRHSDSESHHSDSESHHSVSESKVDVTDHSVSEFKVTKSDSSESESDSKVSTRSEYSKKIPVKRTKKYNRILFNESSDDSNEDSDKPKESESVFKIVTEKKSETDSHKKIKSNDLKSQDSSDVPDISSKICLKKPIVLLSKLSDIQNKFSNRDILAQTDDNLIAKKSKPVDKTETKSRRDTCASDKYETGKCDLQGDSKTVKSKTIYSTESENKHRRHTSEIFRSESKDNHKSNISPDPESIFPPISSSSPEPSPLITPSTSKNDILDPFDYIHPPASIDDWSRTDKSVKKSYVKPPLIEAPFLLKGKRKIETKETEPKEVIRKQRRISLYEDKHPVLPTVSSKYGTAVVADKTLKTQFDKRHNNRKRKYEAPKVRPDEQAKEERRKKLKELADKQAEKVEQKTAKSHTKPKVKISAGRGLFLTGEEPTKESKEPDKKAYKIPKKTNTNENSAQNNNKTNLAQINNSIKTPQVNGVATNTFHPKTGKITAKRNSEAQPVQENGVENNHLDAKNNTNRRNSVSSIEKPVQENGIINGNYPREFKKSNLSKSIECEIPEISTNEKSKRRIRFIETPQIRYFEIDDGNRLTKCDFKDAPIPRKPKKRDIEPASTVKKQSGNEDEDTLSNILMWMPLWLEEQKNMDSSPKVSAHPPLQMLLNFNSPGDYYNIVTPLLLLELWKSIYKDWTSFKNPVLLAGLDQIDTNLRENLNVLDCHCVLTKADYEKAAHPSRGDLLLLEMYLDDGKTIAKRFGYVINFVKRRLNKDEKLNMNLIRINNVIPEYIVRFKAYTKRFIGQIHRDRLVRLRVVSRISPYLRIFRSVSCLNKSPLCKFILKPDIQDYKIPKKNEMKLAVSEKLDTDQLCFVIEATQICTRDQPGIYMIQGPPGTGKSHVIINIIRQLLYGEQKGIKSQKIKILLCAPSNGTVDELAMKLLDVRRLYEKDNRFKMIRMGPPNAIHPTVKDISVPILVQRHINGLLENNVLDNSALSDDYNFRQSKINMLENKRLSLIERGVSTEEVDRQIEKAKSDLKLFNTRNKKEISYHERIRLEREWEENIIKRADIVCTTLSSCMGSRMEELHDNGKLSFTCCIVDEATQSNEQETLIPLMLGIDKLILVGDPAQLPALVLSKEAKALGYGESLFTRIEKCLGHLPDNPVRLLRTQYRMHEGICKFPNEHFYNGKLITPEILANRNECILHPYCLFSLDTRIDYNSDMYMNIPEAKFALLITFIVLKSTKLSIGIITPYVKQKEYIQNSFNGIMKEMKCPRFDVNTVDGFQGQERDVVILSCVRQNSNTFLADHQRLNVSLTRAKYAFFICAHKNLLQYDPIWKKLHADALERNILYQINEKNVGNEQLIGSIICKR